MYEYAFINTTTNERKITFARTYEQAVSKLEIVGNEEWELWYEEYVD